MFSGSKSRQKVMRLYKRWHRPITKRFIKPPLQWVARYSGILNSGVPDTAVPKSLGTNASRYSGIPPLYRTLQTVVAKPPRLLQTRANTQTHTTTSSYIMPCAAGELCNLADVELIAPNERECGHECRGGCGGRLHGMCGEVEDTDSDNPNNHICHTCISKRSLSNPAKRKQGQDFIQPGTSKKHKPGASGVRCEEAPKAARPWGNTKLQIAELLEQKVPYTEIARRFGCGTTAVGSVKQQRETLKAAAATQSRSSSSKSARGGDFLRGETVTAPPPYSDLSEFFGPLEDVAQSAGNSEAGYYLRKAKMSFLAAHAAKPTRQADIRAFVES